MVSTNSKASSQVLGGKSGSGMSDMAEREALGGWLLQPTVGCCNASFFLLGRPGTKTLACRVYMRTPTAPLRLLRLAELTNKRWHAASTNMRTETAPATTTTSATIYDYSTTTYDYTSCDCKRKAATTTTTTTASVYDYSTTKSETVTFAFSTSTNYCATATAPLTVAATPTPATPCCCCHKQKTALPENACM